MFTSEEAHQAGAISEFSSMKQLGVFLLLSGWDAMVMPSIKFVATHLYTWVEKGTVRVKCLAQEHNQQCPRPGACFSKVPEVIFSSSVSENEEVYPAETFCMKGTSVHTKNTRCNHSRPQSLRSFWPAAGIESSGSNHFGHAP